VKAAFPPPPPPPPRLVQLVDAATARTLPCLLRRSLVLSNGHPRALLTPLDAVAALLRRDGSDDYTEVEDAELDALFATAALQALTLRGLLLQRSAYALTLRGALAYNESDVITLDEGAGGDADSYGIEVCTFEAQGQEYLLYSAVDPLVLLAKPESGVEPGDVFLAAFEEAEKSDSALKHALESLREELEVTSREL